MSSADQWLLLRAWLRNPLSVAAIAPSSLALARAMASQVPTGPGWTVELGGGTGSITAGLLAGGVAPCDLVVVERDPTLCHRLRSRFPEVRVLLGDASQLEALLREHGIAGPVRALVSGLPLLSMEREVQRTILSAAAATAGGGPIVQFTYGLTCPVPLPLLRRLGLRATRTARIWRNLPPASVWRFETVANPVRVLLAQRPAAPDAVTAGALRLARVAGLRRRKTG